jgi:hypothetical protein
MRSYACRGAVPRTMQKRYMKPNLLIATDLPTFPSPSSLPSALLQRKGRASHCSPHGRRCALFTAECAASAGTRSCIPAGPHRRPSHPPHTCASKPTTAMTSCCEGASLLRLLQCLASVYIACSVAACPLNMRQMLYLPDRTPDQQYHRGCCACPKRALAMQVVLLTGPSTPAGEDSPCMSRSHGTFAFRARFSCTP